MQITYRLTADDLAEAQSRHRGWIGRMMQFWGVILIGAGVINGIVAHNYLTAIAPLLIGFFFVFGPGVLSRRSYEKDERLHHEFIADIDDDGIAVRGGPSRSEYGWESFTRFVETKSLFILYQAPQAFYILPKRTFNPVADHEFRSLVQRMSSPAKAPSRIKLHTVVFLAITAVVAVLLVMAIRNIH